jgi:hypothetical protein
MAILNHQNIFKTDKHVEICVALPLWKHRPLSFIYHTIARNEVSLIENCNISSVTVILDILNDAGIISVWLGYLFLYHLKLAAINFTTNEDINKNRYFMSNEAGKIINPYDKGIRGNLVEFFCYGKIPLLEPFQTLPESNAPYCAALKDLHFVTC